MDCSKRKHRIIADDLAVFPCSVQRIWNALLDFPSYGRWWPRLVNIQVTKLTHHAIGTQFEVRPLGGRGFVCQIERVVPFAELEVGYVDGIYRGMGVWKIERHQKSTNVSYRIDLDIADPWVMCLSRVMNVAALHSWLMRRVFAGLAKHVAGESRMSPWESSLDRH